MKSDNALFYGQIDLFLSRQLSPEQTSALEKTMADDPALAQAVALRWLEFEVSEAIVAANIREQLQRLQLPDAPFSTVPTDQPPVVRSGMDDVNDQPPVIRSGMNDPTYRIFWVILAVVSGISIAVFYRNRNGSIPAAPSKQQITIPPSDPSIPQANKGNNAPQSPVAPISGNTPKQPSTPTPNRLSPPLHAATRQLALAEMYYKTPDLETFRGVGTAVRMDSAVANALDAWQKKDYRAVLLQLQSVKANDPQYIRALTLRAHAQFQLKQFKSATQTFNSVANSKIMPWCEAAEWYYLLALLAEGKSGSVNFQKQMKKILADKGHPYVDQAGDLNTKTLHLF